MSDNMGVGFLPENIRLPDTGYLPETRPDDFLQGIIPYKVVLENGDWRPFVPLGEPQFSQVADSQGCVSFSNNNAAEISLKQQGFDYNFSDNGLAKLSNTITSLNTADKTKWGNTFGNVTGATYNYGRLLESDWPRPANFTLQSFYADIPLEIMKKAIFFDEDTQFISNNPENLAYHLKQCPIQISIPYPFPNHAVVLVYLEETTAWYFDSYPGQTNYLKQIDVSQINSAMKLIIKPKNMAKYFVLKDGNKEGILVVEGYAIGGGFAADLPDLAKLRDAFNVPDDAKLVELPQ